VDLGFRSRLIAVHVSLVLVIALGAVTAILALRTTHEQAAQSRAIDQRLAMLDRLRADTRELALSARRHVLSGDLEEQQRVLAIVHDLRAHRERLQARATLHKGAMLEADIDEYVAALVQLMSVEDDDPLERLARFEDGLVVIRAPLATTFDEIVTHERARRDAMRSAQWLARGAQWAVLIASVLGVVIAIGAAVVVLRKLSAVDEITLAAAEPVKAGDSLRRELYDAATFVDRALRDHRDAAIERGVRLRYDAQLAVVVFADRERIRHVLDSLLRMAIETARPGAELVVRVATADASVRFAITEAGPGTSNAPPDDHTLQPCTRIVEAHGGRLGVQASAISRTYWFTLPSEPALLR
jgi:signal transduction histidine kinase